MNRDVKAAFVSAEITLKKQIRVQAWLICLAIAALLLSGGVLTAAVLVPIGMEHRMSAQESAGKETDRLTSDLIRFIQEDLDLKKKLLKSGIKLPQETK